jgi:hypothetical protein
VQRRHASDAAVVLEVIIRGRHLGPWRGLRPGYAISTAWDISRTGQRNGAHHHRADAPPYDGANRRAEDSGAGLTVYRR